MRHNKYMKYKKSRFVQPTADQMERWFRKNGIEYKSGNKSQFRICNPDGDTSFCIEISKDKALVHDFRPHHQQYDGTFLRFVSKFKGISIEEAIEEVCGDARFYADDILDEEEDEELEDDIELPDGAVSLREESDSKIRKIVMNYLLNDRKLDESAIMQANIHYLGTSVVVPYHEYGMIVFWQIREILSKFFEFPRACGKTAGDFLYGFDNVEPHSYVIVTEAIFNTLSIGSDCVATGGASLKDGQVKLLKILSPSEIILAPDNDKAGRKSLEKDYQSLKKHNWDISYCLPPFVKGGDDIDWNDMKKMGLNPREYILKNKKKLTVKNIFEGINGAEFKMP